MMSPVALSLLVLRLKQELAADAEIARLKAGNFTDEEFHNLCHNLPEDKREEFFKGCAEFQRKLFGVADVDRFKGNNQ